MINSRPIANKFIKILLSGKKAKNFHLNYHFVNIQKNGNRFYRQNSLSITTQNKQLTIY